MFINNRDGFLTINNYDKSFDKVVAFYVSSSLVYHQSIQNHIIVIQTKVLLIIFLDECATLFISFPVSLCICLIAQGVTTGYILPTGFSVLLPWIQTSLL